MIELQLKAALLRAARDIRLAEFNFSQELVGYDLSELTAEELAWCEKQVDIGTKHSYEVGLNAFTNERWRRERERDKTEEARFEAKVLEEGHF